MVDGLFAGAILSFENRSEAGFFQPARQEGARQILYRCLFYVDCTSNYLDADSTVTSMSRSSLVYQHRCPTSGVRWQYELFNSKISRQKEGLDMVVA